MAITKPFKHENLFCLLKDSEGWTNAFIADLVGLNLDVIQAQARIKHIKDSLFRFTIEKEQCPEIKRIIPELKDCEDVNDMQFDLEYNKVWLISKNKKLQVEPKYIKYFVENYKNLGSLSFKLSELKKPVTVWQNDLMIGLIMPLLTK